jgi:[ribosomal protein S18]-alanine N-acetyltransferase
MLCGVLRWLRRSHENGCTLGGRPGSKLVNLVRLRRIRFTLAVKLTIREASPETHRLLATWQYPPPYDFYDGTVEPVLNPERFFEALDEREELIGFYYFEPKPPDLDYGLGLRPDLTGRGLGADFFAAGLAFARERFEPQQVFLHVASFNKRARRVYERAGFEVVSSHVRTFEEVGEVAFLTMAEARSVKHRARGVGQG